jgi:phosphoribosylaminoimidazole synthetase
LDTPPADTHIFHAGTKAPTGLEVQNDGQRFQPPLHLQGAHVHTSPNIGSSNTLTTSGGRVIAATSTGSSLEAAISQAYIGMSTINFANMHFRRDIGKRSLGSESKLAKPANGTGLTYESAGVSISAGNSLVKRIKPLVASTARPGASAEIGGFGGVFNLYEAGYKTTPKLVTGTDGVGTKLKIAQAIGKHDTIGIDLCAMNVNDLVVQGAEPLFFADTYTCSKLDVDIAEQVIKGLCAGCREANCALIGGETAEMPGLFATDEEYDIVGAATGAIPRGQKVLPDTGAMYAGDFLLGLASNGVHSNGYSLVRKIIEGTGLTYHDRAPWSEEFESVGEGLLLPTRIYVKPLLQVIRKELVKGMAHVTGGGLIDNVPRMLPEHLAAEMDATAWVVPKVLRWLKSQGSIDNLEFAKTWNTGLGMVLVVGEERAQDVMDELRGAGETVCVVGKVIEREGEGCTIINMHSWE